MSDKKETKTIRFILTFKNDGKIKCFETIVEALNWMWGSVVINDNHHFLYDTKEPTNDCFEYHSPVLEIKRDDDHSTDQFLHCVQETLKHEGLRQAVPQAMCAYIEKTKQEEYSPLVQLMTSRDKNVDLLAAFLLNRYSAYSQFYAIIREELTFSYAKF